MSTLENGKVAKNHVAAVLQGDCFVGSAGILGGRASAVAPAESSPRSDLAPVSTDPQGPHPISDCCASGYDRSLGRHPKEFWVLPSHSLRSQRMVGQLR